MTDLEKMIRDEKEDFSVRMVRYRKMHKITQETLSRIIGISRIQIANYETTVSEPKLSMALKISEALGFSLDNLEIFESKKDRRLKVFQRQEKKYKEKIKALRNA